MKRKHEKIPFALIVKQAGLDRAARWMPFFAATFLVLLVVLIACTPFAAKLGTSFVEDTPTFFCLVGVVFTAFGLSCFEFFGSLVDFLSAWLSLRKACRMGNCHEI